jgi:phage shock protein C
MDEENSETMENQTPPQKKLQRSTGNRMIAGVCGGLAEYVGIDPVIVRIVFFVLFWFGSGGLWLYLLLWLIVPEAPATEVKTPPASGDVPSS